MKRSRLASLPKRHFLRPSDPDGSSAIEIGLRERKRRETRASLRLAAIRLCVQRGWENVSVDDIAAAANVSPRTFRNYFSTKAEAVAAGHLERMLRIADELRARPAREPLRAAIANSVAAQFEPRARKSEAVQDVNSWLERIRFINKNEAGLEAWFCPFTNNLTSEEVLDLLADCADRSERLRKRGAEIVFLTGSELSLMTKGILPGDTLLDRAALLADPLQLRPVIADLRARMKELLGNAVEVTRALFGGKLSYASVPLDGVDWGLFDIISTDAGYRTARTAARFCDDIRAFVAQGRAQGKPVAITEFGCAAFRGAADMANRGIADIVEWDDRARPVRLKGEYVRDEDEQARCVCELLYAS